MIVDFRKTPRDGRGGFASKNDNTVEKATIKAVVRLSTVTE